MNKERKKKRREEEVREYDSCNCMTVSSSFFFFLNVCLFLCLETTSESGVSDLETSMTDFRCTCCPYGYHLDTDFMKFLDDMYGPDVLRTLKKIERKRHDVRRRLINEQVYIHFFSYTFSRQYLKYIYIYVRMSLFN